MKTQSFKGEYFMKIGILERRNLSVDCCLVSVVNSLDQLKKKKKTSKKKKKQCMKNCKKPEILFNLQTKNLACLSFMGYGRRQETLWF